MHCPAAFEMHYKAGVEPTSPTDRACSLFTRIKDGECALSELQTPHNLFRYFDPHVLIRNHWRFSWNRGEHLSKTV